MLYNKRRDVPKILVYANRYLVHGDCGDDIIIYLYYNYYNYYVNTPVVEVRKGRTFFA